MQFKGKKIGIASTAAQLGNTIVLKEIERMIKGGADLIIIITEPIIEKSHQKNPLKELLHKLSASCEETLECDNAFFASDSDDGLDETCLPAPPLDLLVIISGFPGLLRPLAQLKAEECNFPLVLLLVPSPGETPAFPQLSSLMEKEGVYFVPFGPLSSNREKEGGLPLLCSRIDLLSEACSAALQGNQLRPFIWDNHHFPH